MGMVVIGMDVLIVVSVKEVINYIQGELIICIYMQLALVVLFHPPTGANTALALGQLALCGGGLCGGSCICGSGGMYMKTTRTL